MHRHSSPWDTKLFEDAFTALPSKTFLSLSPSLLHVTQITNHYGVKMNEELWIRSSETSCK